MAAQVGSFAWHNNLVALAHGDFVVAARAAICLDGFIRLDVTDLDWPVGERKHVVVRSAFHCFTMVG